MCPKTQQRVVCAGNGLGPGIGPSTKERLEKRPKKAKRAAEEFPPDWHSLAMQEMLAQKGG